MSESPTGAPGPPSAPADPDRTQPIRPPRPRRPATALAPAPAPPASRARPQDWRALRRAGIAVALAALAGFVFWALHEAAGRGTSERRAEALAAELTSLQRELALAGERVEAAERARDDAAGAASRSAEPQAAATVVELGPDRDGRALETEIELGGGGPTILLLRPARRLVDPSFVVELVDARGAAAWRGERPRRDRGDRLAVVLPPGSLGVGRYEVRVGGLRAGSESRLATWIVQVVSSR